MSNAADLALFKRVQGGDPRAFREVVDAHAAPLHRYLARRLPNAADVEEVLQEVFIKVWNHAGAYTGVARATTWLHQMAHHAAIDRLRKRVDVPSADQADALPSAGPSPADALAGRELASSVGAALGLLPPRQQEALLLRFEQDLSQAEVAEVMGLTPEAVESLLARGKRKLRELLGEVERE